MRSLMVNHRPILLFKQCILSMCICCRMCMCRYVVCSRQCSVVYLAGCVVVVSGSRLRSYGLLLDSLYKLDPHPTTAHSSPGCLAHTHIFLEY